MERHGVVSGSDAGSMSAVQKQLSNSDPGLERADEQVAVSEAKTAGSSGKPQGVWFILKSLFS